MDPVTPCKRGNTATEYGILHRSNKFEHNHSLNVQRLNVEFAFSVVLFDYVKHRLVSVFLAGLYVFA